MTVRKGNKLTISIQEHMAIDVCPGPIRPIRQISAYFPRLSPTGEPLSPNPAASPLALSPGGGASGVGSSALLSPSKAGARGGGGTLSAASSIETSVDIHSSDSDDCTALGTLEFELRYERATSSLHCTIIRAKVSIVLDSWDKAVLLSGVLSLVLLDCKWFSMLTCEKGDLFKSLYPQYFCLSVSLPLFPQWENEQLHSLEERGRLLLSLQFLPPPEEGDGEGRRGGLWVGVLRCAHLAAMDVNGFSDPYVKTYLKPDVKKKSKHKTAVIKKTLNPEFNEEFFYEISLSELVSKTLEVTVWDYDLGRSNDFIGGVCLSCHSQGDALRHWMDCLRNKGQKVERWHVLTNELPQSTCQD
uniref:Double C2-like domains, alpha n=1 Tax=Astyanax mexicanus TaxID=7994 RepID=A0A8B9JQK9_ASTMX